MVAKIILLLLVGCAAVMAAPRKEVLHDLIEELTDVAQIPIDIAQKKVEIADKVVTKVGEKVEKGINTAEKIVKKVFTILKILFHTAIENSKTARDATQYFINQRVRFDIRKTPNGYYIIGIVLDSVV